MITAAACRCLRSATIRELLSQGASTSDIARRLGVTWSTAAYHIRKVKLSQLRPIKRLRVQVDLDPELAASMHSEHKDRLACGMLIERLPEGLRLTWSELRPDVTDTAANVDEAVGRLRARAERWRECATTQPDSRYTIYLRDRAAFLDVVADVLCEHAERMEVSP